MNAQLPGIVVQLLSLDEMLYFITHARSEMWLDKPLKFCCIARTQATEMYSVEEPVRSSARSVGI